METPNFYRREIDGLRAVAILPVIGYHAGWQVFSGGYVGVDVFFVISGYLITSLILRKQNDNTFSLWSFYERRARRILPALLTIVLVSLPFAAFWMPPNHLEHYVRSAFSTVLFFSNVYFWSTGGYFAPETALNPLAHTWSLSIEEQFYIFFPLFLIITRTIVNVRLSITLILLLASFVLGVYILGISSHSAFYLTPFRIWELLLGALIPLCAPFFSRSLPNAWGQILSAAGLALIVSSVFTFDGGTAFPGFFALIPVAGTALVIIFGKPGTLVNFLLSKNVFVFVGLISYSLYLWHQVIFAFLRARLLVEPGHWALITAISLSFILSFLSWKYIETPFRRKTTISSRLFVGAASCSSIVVLVGCGAIIFGVVSSSRIAGGDGFHSAIPFKSSGAADTSGRLCSNRNPQAACVMDAERGGIGWVIVGDSHARMLSAPLWEAVKTQGGSFIQLTNSACPYVPGLNILRGGVVSDCARINRERRNLLLGISPSVVILSSRLPLYIHGHGFDNMEGGREESPSYLLADVSPIDSGVDGFENAKDVFAQSVTELADFGHKVVLVYPVPPIGWDIGERLWKIRKFGDEAELPITVSKNLVDRRLASADDIYDAIPVHPSLVRVRPVDIFCEAKFEGKCITEVDGEIAYSDENHLSEFGARLVLREVMKQVAPLSPPQ